MRLAGRAAIAGLFLSVPVLLIFGTHGDQQVSAAIELPQAPRGKGERCVEPTAIMRRDHMKFLFHQRDETVHRGIRGAKHSLTACVDCHASADASGEYARIDAPGQFCASCHAFASVEIDCFECHAAKPANSNVSETSGSAGVIVAGRVSAK